MNLFVEESHVDATRGVNYGSSGVQESFTNNVGRLFRSCQSHFGRCTSSVYIDTPQGSKKIGWVFEKQEKYTDTGEPYLSETWVTVHKCAPERMVRYDYQFLD